MGSAGIRGALPALSMSNAPGKIILLGEHAVVYGRPALAIPLPDLQASAHAEPAKAGAGVSIEALDTEQHFSMRDMPQEPLAVAARLTIEHLAIVEPDVTLHISSQIPIASGLGSGAAVATALVRALAAFAGRVIAPDELSPIIFEVEKLFHGTPSGIDNTVVVYGLPVYFKQGSSQQPIVEVFQSGAALHFLVADTGIASSTKTTVSDVRAAWQHEPLAYEALFDDIGNVVERARSAIERGDVNTLGLLMNRNQDLLRRLDVSSTQIETLIAAGLAAGAQGIKLSGGGRGGNVIALVDAHNTTTIGAALLSAGATNVITTALYPTPS